MLVHQTEDYQNLMRSADRPVDFLLSLSMLRKKLFSASKCAKDMLAYRKGSPWCFSQQSIVLYEHGSKCYSMEIFNELTCRNHM